MRRKIEILFFNPSNGITSSKMSEQQQTQSYMSVFIPYIANYGRDDLREIIEQMNLGTISRIDISTRRDRPSNMAFVHFREWNDENPLTKQVKYEMETYEQWSVDVPLDITNPDLSANNYFTLNLRINKNPIPSTTMTIETLSDGLMRAFDLVETIQKKYDTLLELGNQHNDMIEQLTDELLQSQNDNQELKRRMFEMENMIHDLQISNHTKQLSKLSLERQTNAPASLYFSDTVKRSTCDFIDDMDEASFDPLDYLKELEEDEYGFDPRIYGDYTA